MRKYFAAALMVLMLCMLTGCAKKQEPNGITGKLSFKHR